ncbi:MAG: cell division protein FtsZ [Candidatus Solibacter usitatus]|nr:cell division protein FtsZ [Candidatus Solibacter usitatus]
MLFEELSDRDELRRPLELKPERLSVKRPEPREAAGGGLKFDIHEEAAQGTRIMVIGVGGGGSNAVGRMYREGIPGVEFCVVNTDRQALHLSPVPNKLLIGQKVTNGLGAGSNPDVGREAACEDTERLIEMLHGSDMVFVAAGLGGGTGTGAAPVIASMAKELNALTVAIVTKPFSFEGTRRMKTAEKGIADLAQTVDTLIQIPNERLTTLLPKGTPLMESFRAADDVLRQAVTGISDIMNIPGLINRDFADIKAIMLGMGPAMLGCAIAKGENAAMDAARKAITNPILEDEEIRGARGILINITGSSQISLDDVNAACALIHKASENPDAIVSLGVVLDEGMTDSVKVTVVATGFNREAMEHSMPVISGGFNSAGFKMDHAPQSIMMPEPVQVRPAQPIPDQRQEAPAMANAQVHPFEEPARDEPNLEVPAFMRRSRRGFFS